MIDWVQTLVTAGTGSAITLFGTGLTLYFAGRREQRIYARSLEEKRVERFRVEYLAAIDLLSFTFHGAVLLGEEPSTASTTEEIAAKLKTAELTNVRLRLSLLPAPEDIQALFEQSLPMSRDFVIAILSKDDAKERRAADVMDKLGAALTVAMLKDLATMERSLALIPPPIRWPWQR